MTSFEENYKKAISAGLIIFIGLYTVLSVFQPGYSGFVGRFYSKRMLFPVFGHGSYVFGIFLVFLAIFLFLSKRPVKRISGLALFVSPLTVLIDSFFANGQLLKGSIVTEAIKNAFVMVIGKGGFYLTCVLMVFFGLALLVPENFIPDNYNRIKNFILRKLREKLLDGAEYTDNGTNGFNGFDDDEDEEELTPKPKKKAARKKTAAKKKAAPRKAAPKKKTAPKISPRIVTIDNDYDDDEEDDDFDDDEREDFFDFSPKTFDQPSIDIFERTEIELDTDFGSKKDDIIEAFRSFGVKVDIGEITKGPSVEQYEIIPQKGVKLARIKGLDEDISIYLKTKVCILINHEGVLCIEVPCADRQNVSFRYLLETAKLKNYKIPVVLGVDPAFKTVSFDLASIPHLLIAGTTGAGKSILVKSIIASIMYYSNPSETKLVLIDPKRVEFGIFNTSPYLACKSITDMENSETALELLVEEMEKRYDLLEEFACSNISQYNNKCDEDERLPYIIMIVDEFADLMMSGKSTISENIIRIAQKARACGIHIVLATQRPSADVINGLIKANVPGRIALSVSSGIDSKIILDRTGADKLLGKGDMIFISGDYKEGIRLQGAYISDDEILKLQEGSEDL